MQLLKYLSLLILILSPFTAKTQHSINYQGVLRDAEGGILEEEEIDLRFRLLSDTLFPDNFDYEEVKPGILTNAFGVFATALGAEHPDTLAKMDFSKSYFIEVALRTPGSNYSVLHRSVLSTTPYALHAVNVENVDDADADPNNEMQTLSFNTQTNRLAISGGNEVAISAGSGDADPTNELQELSKVGQIIKLSDGGEVVDEVEDEDADPENEIQKLSISGSRLLLNKNGGEVELPNLEPQWENNSNGLFTDKKVGIGMDDPSASLHVDGSIRMKQLADDSGLNYIEMFNMLGGIGMHVDLTPVVRLDHDRIDHFAPTHFQEFLTVGNGSPFAKNRLNLLNGLDASLHNDGLLMLGKKTGSNIVIDNNEMMARNNGKVSDLFLQHQGGHLVILQNGVGAGGVAIGLRTPSHILHVNGIARSFQSTWATSSDRRVKKDIRPIENALSRLAKFNPVTYRWRSEYNRGDSAKHYGFIAQEVREVMPEWVTTVSEPVNGGTIEDFHVLNTGDLSAIVLKGIQELYGMVQGQKNQIEQLKTQVSLLQRKNPADHISIASSNN